MVCSAPIARTGTARKHSPISRTSVAPSPSARRIDVEIFGNRRCATAHRCRPPARPRRRNADGRPVRLPAVGNRLRRHPGRREVQHHRAVSAAASGLCHSRDRRSCRRPTTDEGLGTGKFDFLADAIISGEAARSIELSGFGGFMFRSDADDYELSNGFRWGFGGGLPEPRPAAAYDRTHRRDVLRRRNRVHVGPIDQRLADERGKSHRRPTSSLDSPTSVPTASSSATARRSD